MKWKTLGLSFLGLVLGSPYGLAEQPMPSAPSEELVKRLNLAPFYKQHLDAGGIPIVASEKVSPYALAELRYIIDCMLVGRDDIRAGIADANIRFAIMAPDEFTTDVPEHSGLKPAAYWDKRARGLGATPKRPAVSCGEENVLCFQGDPYAAESIIVHEFAHVVHQHGLKATDESFDQQLRKIYQQAVEEGLWDGKYAGTNHSEYFAEAVQSWFDTNREDDHDHNHVNTRQELREYDPRVAALLGEVFGENDWRYQRPSERSEPSPHLVGYDASKAPVFKWPERVVKAFEENELGKGYKAVTVEKIVAVDGKKAPALAASPAGTKATNLRIVNKTPNRLSLFWGDFEGNRKAYGNVLRNRHVDQGSFVGRRFVVVDPDVNDVATFAAIEGLGSAVVK